MAKRGLDNLDEDSSLLAMLRQTNGNEDEDDETLARRLEQSQYGNVAAILADINLLGRAFWELEPDVRNKTRFFAAQLIVQFLEGAMGTARKLPTYVSRPIRDTDGFLELDVESTLEAKIDNIGGITHPWVYERRTASNPVILLIDTSLSMNGTKLMMAGTVAATLAWLVPMQDLSIVGFAHELTDVKRFDEELSVHSLVSRVLRLAPRGYTDIAAAINRGRQLSGEFEPHARIILLSDAEPTSGKNPILAARRLKKLDVLLFPGGNDWLGKRLAKEADQGTFTELKNTDDIPKVLQSYLR